MGMRGQKRRFGWRRLAAHLVLIGFVFETLIGIGQAGFLAGSAQAADGAPFAFIEICTPTGIQRIAWDGVPPEEAPEQPSEPQTSGYPCLLCAAIGALAPDCLLVEVAVEWPDSKPAFRPRADATPVSALARQPQQSRAPPLSL